MATEEKEGIEPSTRSEGTMPAPAIDDAWARRTLKVARAQASLPDSPGRRTRGGVVALCAAACIAYVGLEIRCGAAHAAAFRADVGATGSKQIVIDAFECLGLGRDTCMATMATNDRTAPADRIAALASLLASRTQ